MSYRIAYLGTPQFAHYALKALIEDERFDIVYVLTQPDKKSGRGQKLQSSPVKLLAQENHLTVLQPESLKKDTTSGEEIFQTLQSAQLDFLVVAAYGRILPTRILTLPRYGSINIHASILPRWRGAAPIQRALEAGDLTTGLSIMHMIYELDAGDVYKTLPIHIEENENAQSLTHKLGILSAQHIAESLNDIAQNNLQKKAQSSIGISYANRLEKHEGLIDWTLHATQIERKIRAFYPWPGSFSYYRDKMVKLFDAQIVESQSTQEPGSILQTQPKLLIQCKDSALSFAHIQVEGKKQMSAIDLDHGHFFSVGQKLSSKQL